jgi:hypothetical protein
MEGNGPQLRALRAALFAALCVTLSVTSHVLLSSMPLPLTAVVGAYAVVFGAAYALGGRERGYWAIAALLVPLELAADTAFTAGQHTCYGPGGGPVTGSWRALTCDGGAVGGTLAHTTGTGPADSASPWLLLAVHLMVGLAASWWLRRGEAALHRVLRTAFRPLAVAMAAALGGSTAPDRRLPAARPGLGVAAAPGLPLLLHSVVRRGPPCSAAS